MQRADLYRMLNQIAANLAPYGEEEAVVKTAEHVRAFWEPRMRARLLAEIEADATGLEPIARAAAARLRG